MRRAVEKHIEDPLSEHLLREDIREGDKVHITFDPELKRLKFSAVERSSDSEEAAVDALLAKVGKDAQ
jgi:ATP-dependent Clp protease ATP-binding subunit ClpA